jgi:hypothetical protein
MRLRPLSLGALLLLVLAAPLRADTVVLKSGRRVTAAEVREEGGRVICETAEGTYAFPRSLVAGIEKSQPKVDVTALLADVAQGPRSTVQGPTSNVDLGALPPDAAATIAEMQQELKRGRTEAALAALRHGLAAWPNDPQLALCYGALLLNGQKYGEARQWLLRASALAPGWPQAWKLLGYADYFSDRTGDAVRDWRKALQLGPDPAVKQAAERAQRELAAESSHEQVVSSHFTLRFEGRQLPPEFRQTLLEELERHYRQLERELGVSLREPITVILYTERAFQDVTQAPSWAGAVNDGRIRAGIEGLAEISAQFSATLMHETVHSFVWAKTHGRCPRWLDEGLAQLFQGGNGRPDARLVQLWAEGQRLPLKSLEGSFNELGPGLAAVAYGESLAVVRYLAERWGLPDVVRLLDRLGAGESAEAALASVYRLDYSALEEAMASGFR